MEDFRRKQLITLHKASYNVEVEDQNNSPKHTTVKKLYTINYLKRIVRTAIEKLSNWSSTDCKRWAEGNSRSRKPDKHKICYDGHHLRWKLYQKRCKFHSLLTWIKKPSSTSNLRHKILWNVTVDSDNQENIPHQQKRNLAPW